MKRIRIVIVEDEPVTARELAHLLRNIEGNISVEITLNSVAEATEWFNHNTGAYDLVFMDIRLADGLSFDLFKVTQITCPVIFVTAYNDYAIQAFKNNGIDYILKPFDEQELYQAVNKYKNWISDPKEDTATPLNDFIEQFQQYTKAYKKSFLIHYRNKLVPVEIAKINWFYTANELVYATTKDNQQYNMEFTIEQLEQQIDPELFFRANRQFIINRTAITEVDFYFNGRLSVKVTPASTEHILISKARVPEFKNWMNR